MAETNAEHKSGARMPPYISFSTLLTFLEELKVNGIPPQIDNSVLKRFSGGVRTQLLSALKYLALLTDDKKPAGLLSNLVDNFGNEPEFKKGLGVVLRSQYHFLSNMDLRTATPTMFADAFRNTFGGQEAVLQKCRTFYLQAAKHAGIELGQRLTAGSAGVKRGATAAVSPKKRTTKTDKPAKPIREANGSEKNGRHDQVVTEDKFDKLLAKFPALDPAWDQKIQAKWFDNFSKLMASVEAEKK